MALDCECNVCAYLYVYQDYSWTWVIRPPRDQQLSGFISNLVGYESNAKTQQVQKGLYML